MENKAENRALRSPFTRDLANCLTHYRHHASLGFVIGSFLLAALLAAGLWYALPETFYTRDGTLLYLAPRAKNALSVTVFILALWVLRPVPVLISSLLPLLLFPLLAIEPLRVTLTSYSTDFVIISGCTFALGAALHRWRLDLRAALLLIFVFGPNKLNVVRGVFGFSAFLSMWVPSAPLAILISPIIISMAHLARKFGRAAHHDDVQDMQVILFCAAASGITIGGLSMLIGTHLSLAFAEYLFKVYQANIGHVTWFIMGLPVLLISSVAATELLTHVFGRSILQNAHIRDDDVFHELQILGSLRREEFLLLVILSITLLCWTVSSIFRASFVDLIPTDLFNVTTISVAALLALFLIPAKGASNARLISGRDLYGCPWWILFYIGCSVALGHALLTSGAVAFFGAIFAPFITSQSLFGLIAAALLVWFVCNIFPNIATNAFVPTFFGAMFASFTEFSEDAAIAMVLCASANFLLPMASTSNMVLYAAGFVPLRKFFKVGLAISLVVVPLLIATPVLLGNLIKAYRPSGESLSSQESTSYILPSERLPFEIGRPDQH